MIYEEVICGIINKKLYMDQERQECKLQIHKFKDCFQYEVKRIWNQRCKEIINWEKHKNIVKK